MEYSLARWLLKLTKRSNKIAGFQIYWYKCLPYVIAEMINPEWKKIQKTEKEKGIKFKALRNIYNTDGNWYILEGLDHFLFGINLITNPDKGILYNDSCHLWAEKLTELQRLQGLVKQGREDIDYIWKRKKKSQQ